MFGFFKKNWPNDEKYFLGLGNNLLGATVSAACHFRNVFECDALEQPISHTSGEEFGCIIAEFCAYSPLHFWARGRKHFKPDHQEQLFHLLKETAIAYGKASIILISQTL